MKINIDDSFFEKLNELKTLSGDDIDNLVLSSNSSYKATSLYKIRCELVDLNILKKIDTNLYSVEPAKPFIYELSNEQKSIAQIIKKYGGGVIWDTNILNNWVNHLLNSTITFVEVDKSVLDFVFEILKDKGFKNVLLNPSLIEFFKYKTPNCIIVRPIPKEIREKSYYISIERLIVSLYHDKLLNTCYESNEIKNIINQIFGDYDVNLTRLYSISKRKKIYDEFKKFIVNNVDNKYLYYD